METAKCAECYGIFPLDEMIRHHNVHVCAGCKPVFIQKLAEGAPVRTGQLTYAGFWRRFLAVLIDGFLVALLYGVLVFAILTPASTAFVNEQGGGLVLLFYTVRLTIAVAYETILIGKYGSTVGKMICHVVVVTPDGGPVTYLRAFGRYFAKVLSALTLLIGYIIAAFDPEKRALHDRICDTRVIVR